jgi:hypothetical protein
LQQQVGRHCAAILHRGYRLTKTGRGLAPSISGKCFSLARIREKNVRTLGILRMKEPCTWLESPGFARGALIGPDDQGLIAYLAIREAGLA